MRAMAEVLLGLGANVGDARSTLDEAIALLCSRADIRLKARSSAYRTAPWGVEDQPPFINACIAVETSLTPQQVLARAQAVENALGRDRGKERRCQHKCRKPVHPENLPVHSLLTFLLSEISISRIMKTRANARGN